MKILLIILSLFCFSNPSSIEAKLDVKIEFGRGTSCYGRGLCKVETLEQREDSSKTNVSLIYENIELEPIRLELPIPYVVENEQTHQFDGDSIYVYQDILVETEIPEDYILIEDGNYSCFLTESAYVIYF